MSAAKTQPEKSTGTVLLAIETSQRCGGVALRDAWGAVHVEELRSEDRHNDDLMSAIDRLCRRCDVSPADCGAVGVSIGPGGFTGLRIAVTTAKMLAEAQGVAIAAVPSALVAGESYGGPGPIGVALASKRGRLWWTVLERDGDSYWAIVGLPGQADAESLEVKGLRSLLGDRHLPEALVERCRAAGVPIVEPKFEARACLSVADRMLRAGQVTDSLALSPLYAREPEAVSLWDARQGKSSR